jgi:hypothetical protein
MIALTKIEGRGAGSGWFKNLEHPGFVFRTGGNRFVMMINQIAAILKIPRITPETVKFEGKTYLKFPMVTVSYPTNTLPQVVNLLCLQLLCGSKTVSLINVGKYKGFYVIINGKYLVSRSLFGIIDLNLTELVNTKTVTDFISKFFPEHDRGAIFQKIESLSRTYYPEFDGWYSCFIRRLSTYKPQ